MRAPRLAAVLLLLLLTSPAMLAQALGRRLQAPAPAPARPRAPAPAPAPASPAPAPADKRDPSLTADILAFEAGALWQGR